jgi:hypothetical protein
MRMLFRTILVAACFAIALGASAQEKTKAAEKPAGSGKSAAKAPPDEKAMMETMMKAGSPGEGHKKLEPLVGTFDAKVTSWMDPAKPPTQSSGTAERKWVLGNRYVEEQFTSTFMDQPFTGIGYTGYDNVGKKYVSVWMDSMSTGIMEMKGTASGNAISETGSMLNPMNAKPMNLKSKMTVTDNDHQTFEMWGPAPDGKMYKMMEITYTRKS